MTFFFRVGLVALTLLFQALSVSAFAEDGETLRLTRSDASDLYTKLKGTTYVVPLGAGNQIFGKKWPMIATSSKSAAECERAAFGNGLASTPEYGCTLEIDAEDVESSDEDGFDFVGKLAEELHRSFGEQTFNASSGPDTFTVSCLYYLNQDGFEWTKNYRCSAEVQAD